MAYVIWTEKSLDDLEQLIEYIAKDAPITARRFAQKLFSRVELLQSHPELGGFISEDSSKTYRELIQGNYRIIYRCEEDAVYVVAIHHAARLLDEADL